MTFTNISYIFTIQNSYLLSSSFKSIDCISSLILRVWIASPVPPYSVQLVHNVSVGKYTGSTP